MSVLFLIIMFFKGWTNNIHTNVYNSGLCSRYSWRPKLSNSCSATCLRAIVLKIRREYEAVYKSVLSEAEEMCIENFEPERVMSDFEVAILIAGKSTFSERTEFSCCFFTLRNWLSEKSKNLDLWEPPIMTLTILRCEIFVTWWRVWLTFRCVM